MAASRYRQARVCLWQTLQGMLDVRQTIVKSSLAKGKGCYTFPVFIDDHHHHHVNGVERAVCETHRSFSTRLVADSLLAFLDAGLQAKNVK